LLVNLYMLPIGLYVCWTGDKFVATSFNLYAYNSAKPYIYVSPDGIIWSQISLNAVLPEEGSLNAIASSPNIIVAVGSSNNVITSADGINWISRDLESESGVSITLSDVVWDGQKFVAVGGTYTGSFENSSAVIFTSHDGVSWEKRLEVEGISHNARIKKVAYSGNNFIAITSGMDGKVFYSP